MVMDTLDELAADGAARKFGLDAPLLAAVAHDIVVVHVYVAEFARIAVLAVVDLAVDDQAQPEAPPDIDVDHVLVSRTLLGGILAVGHRLGVVLDEHRDFQPLAQQIGQRHVARLLEIEDRSARTRPRVDPSADIEVGADDLTRQFGLGPHDETLDVVADFIQLVVRILEIEIRDLLHPHHFARKVHQADGESVRLDIHPQEAAGLGLDPIERRTASPFVGLDAVDQFEQIFLLQFRRHVCHGRDAEIRGCAMSGNRKFLFNEYAF